jgi:hypothetical protein
MARPDRHAVVPLDGSVDCWLPRLASRLATKGKATSIRVPLSGRESSLRVINYLRTKFLTHQATTHAIFILHATKAFSTEWPEGIAGAIAVRF